MKTLLALLSTVLLSIHASAITLEWDANPVTDMVTEYRVYENTSGQYVRIFPTTKITATSVALPTLTNAAHTFVVTAVSDVVESVYSDPVFIPKAPGKPTNLRKK